MYTHVHFWNNITKFLKTTKINLARFVLTPVHLILANNQVLFQTRKIYSHLLIFMFSFRFLNLKGERLDDQKWNSRQAASAMFDVRSFECVRFLTIRIVGNNKI